MPKGKVKAEEMEPTPISLAITSAAQPYIEMLRSHKLGEHFTEPEERALIAIMAICDGNMARVQRIANDLGVHISHGGLWRVFERNMGAFEEQRDRWKKSFASRLQKLSEQLADKLTTAIEEEPLSVRDGMVALGIAVQRGMDLAGEGATITHKHVASIDPVQLAALTERLQSLRPADQGEVIEAEFTVRDE